jgi:putative membrane protein
MIYLKSLHIVFVVAWFSGLFYFVRLLVYHAEAQSKSEADKKTLSAQFEIMEKRLRNGIILPASVLTLVFGFLLLPSFMPLSAHPWLIAKLVLVAALFAYQSLCEKIYKSFKAGNFGWTSMELRLLNEVSTLFLVAIVFLVVTKNIIPMIWAVFGFLSIAAAIFGGLKFVKRKDQENQNH